MEDFAEFEYTYANVNPLPVPAEPKPEDLYKRYSPAPAEIFPGASEVVGAVTFIPKTIAGGISTAYEKVSGTVRNTYLYLVGGLLLVGILAVLVLGAGSRFLGKVEG